MSKKAAKPKRRNPGPAPEVLEIEGNWEGRDAEADFQEAF
jgi:hypothetical protein